MDIAHTFTDSLKTIKQKMLASLRNPFFKRLCLSRSHPLTSPPFSIFSSLTPLFNNQVGDKNDSKTSSPHHFLPKSPLRNSSTSSTTFEDTQVHTSTTTTTFAYRSVRIQCQKDVADMFSEALLCFGASSASMDELEDSNDTAEVCISSIIEECHDVGTCISRAANSVGLKQIPSYEVIVNEQCDNWVKKSLESFHPVEVAEDLWIVPEWSSPPVPQATNIILNPGLAFGTGEHLTTKSCLLLLRSFIKGGENFLDYGTGSGVLAIAAVKFGAALSVGVDIDPQAITSARQNAALNNIEPAKMELFLVSSIPSPTPDGSAVNKTGSRHDMEALAERYDIVVANILLNPLLELADHIVACAKPGAIVALSGILSEQVPQIKERYSQYLEGMTVSEMDGWACVSGMNKKS